MPPRAQTRQAFEEQTLKNFANRELAEPPIVTKDDQFKPIVIWTAGPGTEQAKIVVPGTSYGLKPRGDGSYLLESQDMVDLAKKAFGSKFWPSNIPPDEPNMICDQCNWSCRNTSAFMAHVNHVHPRPQSVS